MNLFCGYDSEAETWKIFAIIKLICMIESFITNNEFRFCHINHN